MFGRLARRSKCGAVGSRRLAVGVSAGKGV